MASPIVAQDPSEVCEARITHGSDISSHLLEGISSEKDSVCIASGRVIQNHRGGDMEETLRCRRCRHYMLMEIVDGKRLRVCTLCHDRLIRDV